jgi:hypothetical protein
MTEMQLGWRHRLVLNAFDGREKLKFHDLPTFVGRSTMSELMRMGLVKAADPTIGPYRKKYEWRRVDSHDAHAAIIPKHSR